MVSADKSCSYTFLTVVTTVVTSNYRELFYSNTFCPQLSHTLVSSGRMLPRRSISRWNRPSRRLGRSSHSSTSQRRPSALRLKPDTVFTRVWRGLSGGRRRLTPRCGPAVTSVAAVGLTGRRWRRICLACEALIADS